MNATPIVLRDIWLDVVAWLLKSGVSVCLTVFYCDDTTVVVKSSALILRRLKRLIRYNAALLIEPKKGEPGMHYRSYIYILLCSVILIACDDDDNPVVPVMSTLQLSFSGIEPLQNGYHYEGWVIVDGAPETTGKFNVNSSGALLDMSGNAIANGEFEVGMDLSAASAVVI